MTYISQLAEAEELIRTRLTSAGIKISRFDTKRYPEETIFVVEVPSGQASAAIPVANDCDSALHALGIDGFVTIRAARGPSGDNKRAVGSLHDERVQSLIGLLTSRARATELQPSLSYIRNAVANLAAAITQRHQLIFGRRGAGKTALMVEAKRIVEADGHRSAWLNVQTFRWDSPERALLIILQSVSQVVQGERHHAPQAALVNLAASHAQQVNNLLGERVVAAESIHSLIPATQQLLRRHAETTGRRIYLFLDDFHYLERNEQPRVLDLLHGAVRDTDSWLKIAAIRNLSRWYDSSRRIGLETPHDADHIDLDLNLSEPTRAKSFLEAVLEEFCQHESISSLSQIYSQGALDRLVLASGGVPRDYLTLAARSVSSATERSESARRVGIQDINNAAGAAAKVKLEELQDDLAADRDRESRTIEALSDLRHFCLNERGFTYFLVSYRDKESRAVDYEVLANLVDLRLVHLIHPSISDASVAGLRYEVFMLDLSQFSGHRLKRGIRVLDFEGGYMVQKETGTKGSTVVGSPNRRLIGLLRQGPVLDLARLARFTAGAP